MEYRHFASLLAAVVLLSACSSKPKNDYDLNYDFTTLHRFSQLAPLSTDDPLSAQRIQIDINTQLMQKGFEETTQQPDFNVTYTFIRRC